MFQFVDTYPYKVKDCVTQPQILEALEFYSRRLQSIPADQTIDIHNTQVICHRLEYKLKQLDQSGQRIPLARLEFVPVERAVACRELVKLLPLLFQYRDQKHTQVDWSFTSRMFRLWMGVLHQHYIIWTEAMYQDLPRFTNCQNQDEMIIFLMHEVITSGLHHPKQIVKQINLTIRLLYQLKVADNLPVILPQPRNKEFSVIDPLVGVMLAG